MACVHCYSVTQNNVRALKILCATPFFFNPSLPPKPWHPSIFFGVSLVLPFPECHLIGIIQCAAFTYGLLHFGVRMEVSPMSVHDLFLFFLSYLAASGVLAVGLMGSSLSSATSFVGVRGQSTCGGWA